ncbi:hypothetical protein A3715_00650 [Oleiphilus sp. HI0009]|uniref:HugZ family pyridoxamine 5'-phosphate oxidase n=1 Tax=unclassified Oleiphilus TaxID=2631174 RepID=UPI0007C40B70|nr:MULTISPECIES: pyridoxamine 5'-phosphate oxidase family protein [unclassified Oleiphilus]KZX82295.1 hypothetical protein A3715_00650 [Oleiphilus sp. HI0009]KZY66684.1 hypothetical protein A3738_05820 [Oleiphilus sp. HI0066]KZY73119.1 hypothetical protein A3739_03040 [Oleiphilus sp. HI0067]
MSNISTNIESLIADTQSCMLATLDQNKQPDASTTPYILENKKLYIFISELAAHTQNLKQTAKCSLMLTQDETDTKNIFARKRLIFKGDAQFIDRSSSTFNTVMPIFEQQRGKTVSLLKSLNDFHLVEIKPKSGTYVEGFGAAYRFEEMEFENAKQETGK